MNAEQNIQVVQKAYADFGRGDIAAVIGALDESVEWTTPGEGTIPTGGTHRGKDGVTEFFRTVAETWDFQSFEPKEFVGSGELVVALGHYEARSRQTGRVTASDWAMVWRIRDGKVVNFQEFTDSLGLALAVTSPTALASAA